MSGNFQTQVNTQPTPAVAGDFADHNPRASVLAGPGGLVAGASGVTVGLFAWLSPSTLDGDNAPAIVNNTGEGLPSGFVHREQQALITTFLADASQVIPAGFQMTLMATGGYWAKNDGTAEAQYGLKVFANFLTGKVSFANAGTVPGGGSGATASIAAETCSSAGSITGNILTLTGATTGTFYPGTTISGTGVASGTQIVSQLTGSAGSAGTYLLNVGEQTVASTTISGTYGLLSNGTVTGAFAVGQLLSGTAVVAGTYITQFVSGTGGTSGTCVVNNNTVVNSATIVGSASIETPFYARSAGAVGEVIKISDRTLG